MTSPLPLRRTAPESGFTLIEIVSVLVLIGILSAAAVSKYFDLQEESRAKVCAQNRAIALASINSHFAASKLDDGMSDLDWSDEAGSRASAGRIIAGLRKNDEPLCPSGGEITAEAHVTDDGSTHSFEVFCSVHSPASGTGGGGGQDGPADSGKHVTRASAIDFIQWIQDVYTEGDWGTEPGSTPDPGNTYVGFLKFFDMNPSAEIDSEANFDGSMSSLVKQNLLRDKLDTSSTIWKIEGINRTCPSGKCPRTITVTIADKPDLSQASHDQAIGTTASRYTMKVTYDADGKPKFSVSEPTETSATISWKKGKDYWVLKS